MNNNGDETPDYGFDTRAVHAGAAPDSVTGARTTPIYQSVGFVFDDADHAASLFNLQTVGFIYTRLTNPTVSVLEERVASLENGRGAVACASGHAAQQLALYPLMESGDEFVAGRFLYGGSITQFSHSFSRFGWTCRFADTDDPDAVRAAVNDKTRCIFVESLANPGGIVVDIEAMAKIAHDAGIPLIVDNTMATPYLHRPIDFGADIVVHSLTKFMGGHGNSLGGVVVEAGGFDWGASGKFPAMTEPSPSYHGLRFAETFGDFAYTLKIRADALRDLGPALSPQNAFNLITGIETLAVRMERHVANAQAVAEFLEKHEKVEWVSYAGLRSSPYAKLAKKYMPKGPGAVFTFGVKGGYEAGVKVVDSVRIFSHLANIGDTRSLIIHPASTTHNQLTDEQKVAAGASPEIVRLSVGIETVDDLIADLDQALAQT